MNKHYYDNIKKIAISKIRDSGIKCRLIFPKEFSYNDILIDMLKATYEKYPLYKTTIIVPSSEYKAISNSLKYNTGLDKIFKDNHIRMLSDDWIIRNVSYTVNTNMVIFLNDYENSNYGLILSKFKTNYIIGLSYNPTGTLPDYLPIVLQVSKQELIENGYLNFIKEIIVPINLSEENYNRLQDYDNFIQDTLSIFGDIKTAIDAYKGDGSQDPETIRYNIAIYNGWSKDLDLDSPVEEQIDRMYNPQNLYIRAKSFSDILQLRKILLSDAPEKIEKVLEIVRANVDKKILIICKRSEFAKLLTNSINTQIRKEDTKCNKLNELNNNLFDKTNYEFPIAMEYHNNVESRYIYNPVLGDYERYKTGQRKGEPKVFGVKNLCSHAMELLNNKLISILCITNSLPAKLDINVDLIINTSHKCLHIFEFNRDKVVNIGFNDKPILFNVIYSPVEYNRIKEKLTKYNSIETSYINNSVNNY